MAPPVVQADTRLLEELVGAVPTTAGDVSSARAYIERIERRLSLDDLNTPERRALYRQRAKWRARADGTDARWMQFGSRSGPLAKPAVDTPLYHDPDLDDPLVSTIVRKYSPENLQRILKG